LSSEVVDTRTDLDEFELVGYLSGLAAGLAKALADLDDTDLATTARSGYAAVPESLVPEHATVVEHPLAAAEGIAILDVRLPAGLAPLRHPGDRPQIVGRRLAAVRIGLARTLLDHALTSPPEPPPCHRLTLDAIADILAALESLRDHLASATPSPATVTDIHTRLTHLDWRVASLFGQDGYRADHPTRALFVADLVASTWLGPPTRR
jgi:hypothetical protein